jgi:hypothetical protein
MKMGGVMGRKRRKRDKNGKNRVDSACDHDFRRFLAAVPVYLSKLQPGWL